MSELAHAATRLALLRALKQQVGEAYETTRAETGDAMDSGDRKAATLGGENLGHITKATGAHRAKVTDEQALTGWVREHYPSEITETVRPAYVSKLLDAAKRYGMAVDESTGEIVPGIDVDESAPYVMAKLSADAPEIIARNWHDVTHYVPELPGGNDE